MTTLRLISGPLSLFSAKVRIALDEKGVDYTLDTVPFGRASGYDPKPREVLARNPKGQVPILVEDDGFTVYDSTLIFQYLEERHPTPPLFPPDVRGRARCRQLEAAADEILFPHVWTLIRSVFYQQSPADTDGVAGATRAIGEHLAGLDAGLAERPHLCGDAFTVADIGYFATVEFARRLGVTADPGLAHLGAWWERVNARPSVARERAGLDESARRVLAG